MRRYPRIGAAAGLIGGRRDVCSKSGVLLLLLLLLLLCLCDEVVSTITYTSDTLEYCQWETFNATCGPGEVIVMKDARYGRMTLGRCIQQDYGHIGCSVSVLPYADSRCSGRGTCAISLPDGYLDKKSRPCPTDLKAYMAVQYECWKVVTAPEQQCADVITLESTSGFISNWLTGKTNKGSASCPWQIRAKPGQSISITLLDFAVWQKHGAAGAGAGAGGARRRKPERSGLCHIYAEIRDRATRSAVTICGGETKERGVYVSETSEVTVQMTKPTDSANQAYYLLKYTVEGCPDFHPVGEVVVRRTGGTTELQCVGETEPPKVLLCQDGRWVGEFSNCTKQGDKAWSIGHLIESTLSLPQGVLIILIISIAILIAVIILAIGIISIRSRRRKHDRVPIRLEEEDDKYSRQSSHYSPKEQYPMLAKPERFPLERESEYTTTLHRRLAVPPSFLVAPSSELPPIPHQHDYPGPCPVHSGNYAFDRQSSTMSTFGPARMEHIYESPRFVRKDYKEDDDDGEKEEEEEEEEDSGPFYHELDPDAVNSSLSTPSEAEEVQFQVTTRPIGSGRVHFQPLPSRPGA